jgi:hypothetical protein
MQDIDFFEGKRGIQQLSISLNKGKTKLDCIIWEEWQMIKETPFTLRCNNKRELKVAHKAGFEQTSTETFESSIGSTLGVKGIASLENSLKSTLKEEIRFQLGKELTDTFSFSSPECGYLLVRLYKKARTFYFKYEDTRFWHKKSMECSLIEWLKPIYDDTVSEKYDPNCNCKGKVAEEARVGIPCTVIFKTFSKLAVFWEDTKQLMFADNPQPLNAYFSDEWKGRIPARLLPDYLRFLTGTREDEYLDAAVQQGTVFFPNTPEVYPREIVNVEFDEDFQLIENTDAYTPS